MAFTIGIIQSSSPAAASFYAATGGTITTSGNYKIHTFSTVGTFNFQITSVGTGINDSIEYLVVAGGGGGGGYSSSEGSGGGGAGGMLEGTITSQTLGAKSIVIGGGKGYNTNGENSSALGLIAYGGGYGAYVNSGVNGGSGGGSGNNLEYSSGVAGQGYGGGAGSSYYRKGGGGGGKSGVGGNGGVGAGAGGAGKSNSISGSAYTYSKGSDANTNANGVNYGDGGGGTGKQGIVILKYKFQ